MDKELFVQNIKFFCAKNNVKPTVACREAGVSASFINNIAARGQTPSVEKVQMLAQYLGVTVSELLGETTTKPRAGPTYGDMVLRDSAVVVHPTDFQRLTVAEVEMILAYRKASTDDKMIVDAALRKYKGNESTPHGVG